MSVLFPDTNPKAEEVLIRLLRETPSWRKMELVGEMNAAVKSLMLSGLKSRYPDDPPELLRRRMADLLLGPELATRVYGPIPEDRDAA